VCFHKTGSTCEEKEREKVDKQRTKHKIGETIKKKEKKMVLKMYSVYDQKAEVFNPPFFQNTHGQAERSFRQTVSDEKTMMNKYPEDYDLYYLGEYDDNTGKFNPLASPEHQLKAIQLVQEKEKREKMS
jgi:hypothetical protein